MGQKVKTVVIGFGHLGKWHAQKAIALDSCEFMGVVEPSTSGRERFKEAHPEYTAYESIESIIDEIDAAIVVSPTIFHYEIVKRLLEHGKHVFCEKPITSTLAEALEIGELVDNRQVVFQAGHSERFHQIWEEKNKYPEFFNNPGSIRIQRLAPFKGRATDVDVVQDLMIHDIDLLCHLFDEEPVSVRAVGHKIRTDLWDYVSAQFHFSSGRDAFITVGRNHYKEVRDMDITNQSGCLHVDLMNRRLSLASFDEAEVLEVDYPARDHLLEEQKAFYESILNNEHPVVDVKDGILAVKLVNHVLDSLEQERTVEV